VSDELNALPPGWEWASLRDVCDIERGVTFPASAKSLEIQDGYIVCLRTANVQEEVDWDDLIYIPEEYVKKDTKFLCLDDILISMANSLELVGKVSYVDSLPAESTFGGFISAIRVKEGVESKYLFYYLRFGGTQAILRDTASRSVNIANLSLRGIYPTPVAVAPLAEQRRIVGKIEALFAQSRTARQALDAIPPLIQQFQRSLLVQATNGFHLEQRVDDEPACTTLERALDERQRVWEEELISEGKNPNRYTYEEPPTLENGDLEELPAGWCWATIGQIVECLDRFRIPINKKERENRQGNIPYYGANGQVGWIDDYIFDEPLVLVVEDETFVGREKPFSYKIEGKSWVNNHAHVLRPSSAIDIDYLNYSLAFYPFVPLTSGTTGRRKLNQRALLSAPYPLPPLKEQKRIVAKIKPALELLERLENTITIAHRRAEMLDQAILARAFCGELVPQDPADEPASVLLGRIQAEG
jgi:type I restriction enzyme S subunit